MHMTLETVRNMIVLYTPPDGIIVHSVKRGRERLYVPECCLDNKKTTHIPHMSRSVHYKHPIISHSDWFKSQIHLTNNIIDRSMLRGHIYRAVVYVIKQFNCLQTLFGCLMVNMFVSKTRSLRLPILVWRF